MVDLHDIRYLRIGTPNLEAAIEFATKIVGLQLAGREGKAAYFRSDKDAVRGDTRDHTLVYFEGDPSDHEYGNGVAIFTRNGDVGRNFTHKVNCGMVGINVPIPVPLSFHSFGGWKHSIFGDMNQHGPEGVRFYTRIKTVTSRWREGVNPGANFGMPLMK